MSQTSLNVEGKKEIKDKYEKGKPQAIIPSMASVKTGVGLLESRDIPRTSIQLPLSQSFFSGTQYLIPPRPLLSSRQPQPMYMPQPPPISMNIPTGSMMTSQVTGQVPQSYFIPQTQTFPISQPLPQQYYMQPEMIFPQANIFPPSYIQSQFAQQPPVYQITQQEFFPETYREFSQFGTRTPLESTQQILQSQQMMGQQFTEIPAIPTLESIISKEGEDKSLSQKIISMLEQVVNYSDQIPQEIIYEERLYEMNGEVYLMPCITKIY